MTINPSFPYQQIAVSDQRHPVASALSKCMAIGVLELTNPAAGAADDLKTATATVASEVVLGPSDLKTAGKTKLAAHGARSLTFTTAGVTPADAPANVAIVGKDILGVASSETLVLSQVAGAVETVNCYSEIVSLTYPAADGTDATVAVGIGDKFGFPSKLKSRGGGACILAEIEDGSVVGTGGAAATAVNQSNTTGATVDSQTVKHTGYAWFQNPIAAELVSIVADVLLADGAQVIAAQPDYPRKLQIRVTDGDSSISAGTVTVVGVGAGGEALSEEHSLVGGTQTIDTDNAFATVTSATVAGLVGHGAGDNIGIGVGSCLGLPIPGTATGLVVHKVVVDDADEAVAGVDTAANAVDPTTAPNATHDYGFFYSYDMAHSHTVTDGGHTHTQNSHTHAGAEGEGTFVAAATSTPHGAYTPTTTPNGAHDYAVIYERDVS